MAAELATPADRECGLWPDQFELDDVDVDSLLDMAAQAGPGPEQLEILLTIQRRSRSVAQSLRLGALFAKASNWLSGQETLALAEAVDLAADDERSDRRYGHRPEVEPGRLLVQEYGLLTARTPAHVQTLLEVGSLGLTDQAYCRVLESGVVDEAKAKVICRVVDGLTHSVQDHVDGRNLAKWRHDVITLGARLARHHHWQRVERELAKFTDQLCPDSLTDRHKREYAKRYVSFIPRPAAMAELRVYGAYDELGLVYGTLTKLAIDSRQTNRTKPSPAQTLNQVRYDELIAALTPAASSAEVAKRTARLTAAATRPHLLVAVNASTLVGLDDDPAMVLGGSALPSDVARRIAACSTWQQLLTDPVSQRVVAIGQRILPPGEVFSPDPPQPDTWPSETLSSNSYTPSPRLKRLVAVRDQTCRIPTCAQPAWRCEIDHIEEFDPAEPANQQTVASNLELLCKSHHELKTKLQWDLTRDPATGQTTISTSLGHTVTLPPATIFQPEFGSG